MRKRYKNKKRTCVLCKPHKRGMSNRWKNKDEQELKMWEKTEKEIEKTENVSEILEE